MTGCRARRKRERDQRGDGLKRAEAMTLREGPRLGNHGCLRCARWTAWDLQIHQTLQLEASEGRAREVAVRARSACEKSGHRQSTR